MMQMRILITVLAGLGARVLRLRVRSGDGKLSTLREGGVLRVVQHLSDLANASSISLGLSWRDGVRSCR